MLSWIVTVEKRQEVIFVDFFVGSVEYISSLLRIARYVDERLSGAFIRVISPGTRGVIGYKEWEKEPEELIFEGAEVILLAKAARQAGLNYE